MNRHIFEMTAFKRHLGVTLLTGFVLISLLLAATLLPGDPVAFGLPVSASPASATTLEVTGKVADPNTSTDMRFVDVPMIHDGRIWTDKSVDTGSGEDDFVVTFSALSQTFPVTAGYQIPADTVFVIDVSGSMTNIDPGAGRRRISILVEALNEAIAILQDANPQNRVAVVAYGGRSGGYGRVENVLNLGRYTAPNNAFLAVGASGTSVTVNAVPTPGSGGSVVTSSLAVAGSTPTQWGIYEGTKLLINAADTTTMVPNRDGSGNIVGEVEVTRRPNIILMTDGEPTMAWTNYSFNAVPANPLTPGPTGAQLTDAQAPNTFFGDGSYGELGVSFLTVLTAAHQQTLVFDNYFPGGTIAGQAGQPAADVGFFTIGMGAQPTAAAATLIAATMDPGNNADAVTSAIRETMNLPAPFTPNPYAEPSDPTMAELLADFSNPVIEEASFNAQRRQSFGTYVWDAAQTTVANTTGLSAADIDFADAFFRAENVEDLREAFLSIMTDIQVTSIENVTNVETSSDFDGWLIFSDVLGDYMEFRDGLSLEYDGVTFSRNGFDLTDAAIRAEYEPILLEHLNYGLPAAAPELMTPAQVAALIDANIAAGNTTSVVYFADTDRNFLGATNPGTAAARVEVFPMVGQLSATVAPADQTDLMYITFHHVTALTDGTFTEVFSPAVGTGGAQTPTNRSLKAGDQLVRWYIPASLIPLRTVDGETGAVSGNTQPVRVSFVVGLDQEALRSGVSGAYAAANSAADGSVYFYTNRWRGNENVTLVFDQPHADNPFYQPGSPGYGDGHGARPKSANPTGTAGHVSFSRNFSYQGNPVNLHWMGNNGRLTATLTEVPDEVITPPGGPTPPTPPTTPSTPSTPTVPGIPHLPAIEESEGATRTPVAATNQPHTAPQTGDFRNMTTSVAFLLLGATLVAGTSGYWYRRLFPTGKALELHKT